MKIVISIPYFFPLSFGGGQVYVRRLATELLQRGYEVTVLTSTFWQKHGGMYHITNYKYEGLKVTGISLNPKAMSEADKYSELSPILLEGVRNMIKKLKPDIVHINGLKPGLITVCNQLEIPSVVTAHHPGFACPVSTLLKPDESLCEARADRSVCVPCCCLWKCSRRFHGKLLELIPPQIYRAVGKKLNRYEKIPYLGRGLMFPWLVEKRMEGQRVLLRESQSIISPSRAMKRLLLRNNVPEKKIFLLPHGIEPLEWSPVEKLNDRPIRFGYIGRIDYAKGFHILLQAIEKMPSAINCELHIFGDAQNEWDKKYFIDSLSRYKGKARIYNYGYISNDKLLDAYKKIDILVVPSIYLEVFGLVILEGFSAGRPMIVSKSGGPEELVRDGVDGFVVERNNADVLADAMQRFVDNPELTARMAQQIPHVRTIQEHVDEVEKIYLSLCFKTNRVVVSSSQQSPAP